MSGEFWKALGHGVNAIGLALFSGDANGEQEVANRQRSGAPKKRKKRTGGRRFDGAGPGNSTGAPTGSCCLARSVPPGVRPKRED